MVYIVDFLIGKASLAPEESILKLNMGDEKGSQTTADVYPCNLARSL